MGVSTKFRKSSQYTEKGHLNAVELKCLSVSSFTFTSNLLKDLC